MVPNLPVVSTRIFEVDLAGSRFQRRHHALHLNLQREDFLVVVPSLEFEIDHALERQQGSCWLLLSGERHGHKEDDQPLMKG